MFKFFFLLRVLLLLFQLTVDFTECTASLQPTQSCVKGERTSKSSDLGKTNKTAGKKMKSPNHSQGIGDDSSSHQYQLFTTFSYNCSNKRLTMIPVKYKIKEERRKVLKMSVNKLKKIDDPESWLCRSVLINNTMKKLQKETRDEKLNKQSSCVRSFSFKPQAEGEQPLAPKHNNNNNNDDGVLDKTYRVNGISESEYFFEKDLRDEEFRGSSRNEEFPFFGEKESKTRTADRVSVTEGKSNQNECCGVPLNEDFVEKIPSIKRCSSRKKSVDEDGIPNEILGLKDPGPKDEFDQEDVEVDDCDVHDVLSQLYMPPTPRMLTSIDSDDTDEDELNVVDIDSSYMEDVKDQCPKLPDDELFEKVLPGEVTAGGKRQHEEDLDETTSKRRKPDRMGAFQTSYDSFLNSNNCSDDENERTSKVLQAMSEEELIELEDEEDIERRLSQSFSSHYHRKSEKPCDNFFEDNCDNQFSCGHTATMFNDMQSVTFHNLIASLET